MAILDASQDAFGQALVDHHEGRGRGELLLESDDGAARPADMQPADFFAPPEAWLEWERRAVALASGAVLDLGAGAGRHAMVLQGRGHSVTALDASPGAVAVCRARGIRDVRLADLTDVRGVAGDARWDTVLLLGGNLGLAGDWVPTRTLLAALSDLTSLGGVLIGDSVDPSSDDPDDLAYEARNVASGLHRGHVRLRLRYGDLVTPWWDLLNLPPTEIEALVDGTGWALEDRFGDDDGYAVVLRNR